MKAHQVAKKGKSKSMAKVTNSELQITLLVISPRKEVRQEHPRNKIEVYTPKTSNIPSLKSLPSIPFLLVDDLAHLYG